MDQAGSRTQLPSLVVAAGSLLLLLFGTVGPIRGILVAFVPSLINLARNAAHPPIDILHGEEDPHVSLHDSSEVGETAPGLLVVRFAAPIFFANSEVLSTSVRAMVAAAPHPVKAPHG